MPEGVLQAANEVLRRLSIDGFAVRLAGVAQDDPEDMRRLISSGVDGIQTDRPDLLAPIMTEMLGRPTAPCLGNGNRG